MNPSPTRKRQRLVGFDYAQPGSYFITICTDGRRCLFGKIREGTMQLNRLGVDVSATWRDLPDVFPEIVLDEFVVMPNHVHGVVVIQEASCRGIPDFVRSFKSWAMRRAGWTQSVAGPMWQRGYYDHVVRNSSDLDRIRQYIRDNPATWDGDLENPDRV